MMETAALRDAYQDLIAASHPAGDSPAAGEWGTVEVLAHVSLVGAATIAAVADIAAGALVVYDNRTAQDSWTIGRTVAAAGGLDGLRSRVARQFEALCALVPSLGTAELATPVPTLLLSNGTVLVDQPLALQEIVTGLAEGELPGHAAQLRALHPGSAPA
jgi:hypothetical protein